MEAIKLFTIIILTLSFLPSGFYFIGKGIESGNNWNMLWAMLSPALVFVLLVEVLRWGQ